MKSSPWRDRPADAEVLPQRPAHGPGRAPGNRPLVALLIAGQPEDADRFSVKLRLDGYSVVPATGLEHGLELAGAARPDLIFVCLGSWAVPALVLLVLRSDRATRGVPTILVSDRTREEFAQEVGGMLPTENVVPRSTAVHAARQELALSGRQSGCGQRVDWAHRPRG